MINEKIYDFEASKNFRDLGGYPTLDGKTTKFGKIIRGARLYDLTEKDRLIFNQLGVKIVFDLRSKNEADEFPNYNVPNAQSIRHCALYGINGEEIDFSPDNLERNFGEINIESFTNVYKMFAFNNKAYLQVLTLLEENNQPLFFHCSSGKDRTGILAIIILMALGVSKENALYDYQLTNKYNWSLIQQALDKKGITIEDERAKEEVLPIYGVIPQMAEATIDEIFTRYGTFENYMEKEYGFTKDRLEKLRTMYTE